MNSFGFFYFMYIACIDVAIVDMPFGMRCGNTKLWKRSYPILLAQLARVLRVGNHEENSGLALWKLWEAHEGGKVVLMTALRKLLRQVHA